MYQKPPCPFPKGQSIAWQVYDADRLFWQALGAPLIDHDGGKFVLLQTVSDDVFGGQDANARNWKYGQFVEVNGRRFFLKYLSERQIQQDAHEQRPNYAAQEAAFWSYSPRLCRSYGYQTISRYRTDTVCGTPDARSEVYHAVLLEALPGIPAAQWIAQHYPDGAPPAVGLPLAHMLLQAIADYGAGASAPRHLDIRPHNIMIDGVDQPTLRLFDYDWCHTSTGVGHTLLLLRNHCIEGNDFYLIPLGDHAISCRCDLYQFALTVCYFFTGFHCRAKFPANAHDPKDMRNYGLPEAIRGRLAKQGLDGLANVLTRCLAPMDSPNGYADVCDALRDLERLTVRAQSPIIARMVWRFGDTITHTTQLPLLPFQPYPLIFGACIGRTAKKSRFLGQTLASVYGNPQSRSFHALIWDDTLCTSCTVPDGLLLRLALTPDGQPAQSIFTTCTISALDY